MKRNFTYIDNSNLFIEGCRVSAVMKHWPGATTVQEAMANRVVDLSWRLNYRRLREFVCTETTDDAPKLWGSTNGVISSMIEREGFNVNSFARNAAGKEKGVDVAIAYAITKDAYSGLIRKGVDEITLVAGDSDFIPMVDDLRSCGHIVHLVFWEHAAQGLKRAASRFFSLNPHHRLIEHGH